MDRHQRPCSFKPDSGPQIAIRPLTSSGCSRVRCPVAITSVPERESTLHLPGSNDDRDLRPLLAAGDRRRRLSYVGLFPLIGGGGGIGGLGRSKKRPGAAACCAGGCGRNSWICLVSSATYSVRSLSCCVSFVFD